MAKMLAIACEYDHDFRLNCVRVVQCLDQLKPLEQRYCQLYASGFCFEEIVSRMCVSVAALARIQHAVRAKVGYR